MNGNVIRTITIRGTSEGLDKLQTDLVKLAGAHKGVAIAAEETDKKTRSLEQSWKAQTLRLDEAARAQDKIARETKIANQMLNEQRITTEQHAERLNLINQRYATASASTQKFTQQTGLARHELINLGRQAQDVAVSIAGGQGIGTVLLQQGSQIADVFAAGGKSVGSFFTQAIGWARQFATSTAGIVTGVVTIGATAAMAGTKFAEAQNDISRALAGIGRASQLSVRDIEEIGKASSSVHALSIKEANETASVFASTGKMAGENIAKATKLTHDFATVLGVDTADATKLLAEGLTTGIAGVDKLNEKYQFLIPSQREYLKDLDANVDKTQFQAAVLEMLSSKMVKASELTTTWSQGWTVLGNITSNVFRTMGEVANAPLPTKEMDALIDKIKELEAAREQLQQTGGMGGGLGALGAAKTAEDMAKLNTQIANVNLRLTELQGKQLAAKFGEIGSSVLKVAEAFTQTETKARELERSLKMMEQARAMPEVRMTMSPEQLQQLDRGTEAMRVQAMMARSAADEEARRNQIGLELAKTYGTQNIEVARTLDVLNNQAKVAGAIGVTAQINAQHQATINQLLREGKSLTDAIAIANAQRAVAQAQINAEHERTMIALRGQLSVAQESTGIGRINAQYEADIVNLKQQGLSTSQAIEQAEMRRAIALAQVKAQAEHTLRNLQRENEIINAAPGLQQDMARARKTYNDLVDQGVEKALAEKVANQELQNAIDRRAEAHKTAVIALEGQLAVAQQITGLGKINAQYEADINNLLRQGLTLSQAIEQATLKREIALAQVNSQAQITLRTLKDEAAVLRQTTEIGKDRVRAEQEYRKLIEDGVNPALAEQIKQQMLINAELRETEREASKVGDEIKSWSVQMDEANDAINRVTNETGAAADEAQRLADNYEAAHRALSFLPAVMLDVMAASRGTDIFAGLQQSKQGGYTQFDPGGYTSTTTQSQLILQAARNRYGEGNFTLRSLPGGGVFAVSNKEEEKVGSEAWYNKMFPELKKAIDENTKATQAQTDVLSPFYSSDPRKTFLGFRAFAGGGIMTSHGELPLRQYQDGGVATTPQVAVFGEGNTPEAYVPLKGGGIPVNLKMPANNNQRPVIVNINVNGNADAGTVAALKQTSFQKAQQLRRVTG